MPGMSSVPETPVNEKSCPMSLTPPSTPLASKAARPTSSLELGYAETAGEGDADSKPTLTPIAQQVPCRETAIPRPCTTRYQRQGSASSGYQELGHGAWSTVFRATECLQPQPSPFTPPTSPVSGPSKPDRGRLLAVKTAARRAARDVLYQEARILTYLHSYPSASNYLVPFHGYDTASQSLIMDAVPLNLEMHAKSCLQSARQNLSTRTMFDPVCGNQDWQSLATQLIDGLTFLHGKSCVHGDIKPANILLQPKSDSQAGAYMALYCDFSSSQILSNHNRNNDDQSQQLTALTPDFASPELFSSLHGRGAVPTTASDVYALGVTLIVAAIGTSPYAGASMEVQKLSMAREGRALDFARNCEQGSRAMKGKIVERCLKHALEKNIDKRSTVAEWRTEIYAILNKS
ncbi:MAG: hypothetical protein Q9170_007993 [Blastenia crenularia]